MPTKKKPSLEPAGASRPPAQEKPNNSPSAEQGLDDERQVLFVDCGAAFIKAALYTASEGGCRRLMCVKCIPNAVGIRSGGVVVHDDEQEDQQGGGNMPTVVGTKLMQLAEYRRLLVRRPMQRGLLTDVDLQETIWRVLLDGMKESCVSEGEATNGAEQRRKQSTPPEVMDEPHNIELVLTLAAATPPQVAALWDELCFNRIGFAAVTCTTTSFLSLIADEYHQEENSSTSDGHRLPQRPPGTAVVVDSGFSHTIVTPYINYKPIRSAIRKIDVGGKVLTNRLKEVVSFTQLNVLEETWLMNAIKECLCCVSPHGGGAVTNALVSSAGDPRDVIRLISSSIGRDGGVGRLYAAPLRSKMMEGSAKGTRNVVDRAQRAAMSESTSSEDDEDDNAAPSAAVSTNTQGNKVLGDDEDAEEEATPFNPCVKRYLLPTCGAVEPIGFPVSNKVILPKQSGDEEDDKKKKAAKKKGKSRGAAGAVTISWKDKWKDLPGGPQALQLGHEQFLIPEALFRPLDIGLEQVGVSQLVCEVSKLAAEKVKRDMMAFGASGTGTQDATHAVVGEEASKDDAMNTVLMHLLLSNVVMVGGTTNTTGFCTRLLNDVQTHRESHTDSAQQPFHIATKKNCQSSMYNVDVLEDVLFSHHPRSHKQKLLSGLHKSFRHHQVDALGDPLAQEAVASDVFRTCAPLLGCSMLLMLRGDKHQKRLCGGGRRVTSPGLTLSSGGTSAASKGAPAVPLSGIASAVVNML